MPIAEDIKRAVTLLRDAQGILRRASERDEPGSGSMTWAADVARETLYDVCSDLESAAAGEHPLARAAAVRVGKPEGEDGGGGFAWRALQALALCREAWSNADHMNAPRMEQAMAWIARAWLETCGYQRANVVRAVLGFSLDRPECIVAAVNERMAAQGVRRLPV